MTTLRAIQLSIGDELLVGRTVDTNAAVIARALVDHGIPVEERLVVSDAPAALGRAFRHAVERAPLVISSGGLGATRDDRTRHILAELAGVDLVESPQVHAKMVELARRRGRAVHPSWLEQTRVPANAELLDNPAGLAPALWVPIGGATVCALPGVPREVQAIVAGPLSEKLASLPGRASLVTRTLRLVGVAESDLDRELGELELAGIELAFLPGESGLDLVLRAGPTAAASIESTLDSVRGHIEMRFGPCIYAEGEVDLAAAVLDRFHSRGWTIVTAESCTGGWIAKRLTDVPGSSEVLHTGFVTYSNAAKTAQLGVPQQLIERHGAVSEEVATAMAVGARAAVESAPAVAIAVTGIAGPGGGSESKPLGLVHVAIAGPVGAVHRELRLTGTRDQIRGRTVTIGLDLLRRYAAGLLHLH